MMFKHGETSILYELGNCVVVIHYLQNNMLLRVIKDDSKYS